MRKKHHPEYPPSQRPYDFLRLAYQFHEAFKLCRDFNPPNIPGYFLGCQTVELALKSYLLRMGVTIEDIVKKYGHKIDLLLQESLRMGLNIRPADLIQLRLISHMHSATLTRYPMEKSRPIYVINQSEQAISNLLHSVDPYTDYVERAKEDQSETG
jgi:hypothetical protein